MEKVLSIAKPRKVLGKASVSLTDTQIQTIITDLQLLAKQQLFYNGSKENVAGHESRSEDTGSTSSTLRD